MLFADDEDFERLRSLIHQPASTCPDWLKEWRNEATQLLVRARRAEEDDNLKLFNELADQVREMADMVEARWKAEGL